MDLKLCPTCKTFVFDDMDTCYGCMYRFGSDPEREEAVRREIEGSDFPEEVLADSMVPAAVSLGRCGREDPWPPPCEETLPSCKEVVSPREGAPVSCEDAAPLCEEMPPCEETPVSCEDAAPPGGEVPPSLDEALCVTKDPLRSPVTETMVMGCWRVALRTDGPPSGGSSLQVTIEPAL